MREVKANMIDHFSRIDISHINSTCGSLYIDGRNSSVWSYLSDDAGVQIFPPEDAAECGGRIKYAFTECSFGGRKRWLVCPRCNHRRESIFVTYNGLACRKCLDLRYPSQYGSHTERIIHRASSIERKILKAAKNGRGRETIHTIMMTTQLKMLREQVINQLKIIEQGRQ